MHAELSSRENLVSRLLSKACKVICDRVRFRADGRLVHRGFKEIGSDQAQFSTSNPFTSLGLPLSPR